MNRQDSREQKRQMISRGERAHPGMVLAAMREMQAAEARAASVNVYAVRARHTYERVKDGIRGIDFCGCDHGCLGLPTQDSPFCDTHSGISDRPQECDD